MVSEPRSSREQDLTMSNPNHASSSSSTKSPSPSSNLSLLISKLGSFISVKLDSTNFIIWKDQWEYILKATGLTSFVKATGLTSFVDGTGVQPTPRVRDSSNQEVANPEFLQWIVDDAHLTSCISGTLSSSIYPVVLNCGTSRDVWCSISKRFTTLSRSHVHQLKNRLTAITKNSSSMENYLEQIKNLNEQLTLAGAPVDNEDLVLITLNGLSEEYRPFKTSIRTRPTPVTMEELCSLLLSEAIHEEPGHKTRSTTELNVAFSSVRGGYSNQGQRNNFSSNNRGYRHNQRSGSRGGNFSQNRGNFGGNSGNYRGWGNSREGGRPSGYSQNSGYGGYVQNTFQKSSGLLCQICNKPNHSAFECRHRLNMDYQPQPYYPASSSSQPGQFTSSSSQNKAYIASVPGQSNSDWYVDSAASTHITNDLSSLSLYEPYRGTEQVTVGDGSTLPIQHTGHGQGPQEGAFSGPAY